MAKFTFGKTVDIHWNGYEIVGPALTVFSIPDQLYEEFEGDFRDIEPSLTWTDTDEFATLSASVSVTTLSATTPIVVSATSTGKIISISSATNPAGYYLRADGTGATTWAALPADATGITNIIGTSPISAAVVGTTATISLNANYQTAGSYQPSGTYVTGVVGTSPISATGTTAITLSLDANYQTAGTYVNAVIGTSPASVSTASGTSTVSIVAASINSTHLSATSVGSSQLIDGSVTSDKLGAASVVAAKIAAGAVGFAALVSGSVNSSILAANAVVAANISAAAVGTAALSSGAATNGQVLTADGSGAVTYQTVSAREGKVVSGKTTVTTSSITGLSGDYYLKNLRAGNIDVVVSSVTSKVNGNSFIRINTVSSLTKITTPSPLIAQASQTQAGSHAKGVATDGNVIIIGNSQSAGRYSFSTDGLTFSAKTYGSSGVVNNAYYGGGLFVLIGQSGNLWISPNGTTWTQKTSGFNATAIRSGTYGNGTHVVIGDSGKLSYSTDNGETWTNSTPFTVGNEDIRFGNGLFIVVGSQYSGTPLFTSTNGVSWTQRAAGTGGASLASVAYGDGLWIAICNGTSTRSNDGSSWTSGATPLGDYIDYINGYWIVANAYTAKISSNGASTFTDVSTGLYYLKNGAYHNSSGSMIFSSSLAPGTAGITTTDGGLIDVEFTPISYQSITS